MVMRTFRWNAPIIIGAGAVAFLLFAPAPSLLTAGEIGAGRPVTTEGRQLNLRELKARLDRSDRAAACRRSSLPCRSLKTV